jgi:hypothetical protein
MLIRSLAFALRSIGIGESSLRSSLTLSVVLGLCTYDPAWGQSPPAESPPGVVAPSQTTQADANSPLIAGKIPFTTALKATSSGTLVVLLAPLGGTVQKGDRLLVLTSDQKGVITRAIVSHLNPSGKTVQVRVLERKDKTLPGLIVSQKLAIVRAEQLMPFASEFNAGPVNLLRTQPAASAASQGASSSVPVESSTVKQSSDPESNPLFELLVTGTSEESTGLRYLSGSELTPQVTYLGLQLTLFAPQLKDLSWLNWFGLRLHQRQYSDYQIKIVRSKTEDNQIVKLSGQQLDLALLLRLNFASRWLSYAGLRYNLQLTENEQANLSATDLDQGAEFTLRRQQSGLGFEIGANLLANFFLELAYAHPLQGKQEAKDALTQNTAPGSWKRSEGSIGGGIRSTFSLFQQRFALSARGAMVWKQESSNSEQLLGSNETKSLGTQGLTFGLGLSYIH